MSIWDRIRAALEPHNTLPAEVEHQLRLATGALLLEMCRADFKIHAEERRSIARAIKDGFSLSLEETRELMEAAETQSECAVSLQIYTSLIKDHGTHQQKLKLIDDLWRVAFADNELHDLELNLVNRIAGLIEISPRIVARARAKIEQQLASAGRVVRIMSSESAAGESAA